MTRGIAVCAVVITLAATTNGCERERRITRDVPPAATPGGVVQVTELQAGPAAVDPTVNAYQENRWAVSEGQTYYEQFNCAGCHSPGGGGAIGPPLNDGEWIYGSDPENIYRTIVEGRPNGMPTFRGKINNLQLWQIVAYVRSLSGLTPPDTWSGRTDHMQETRPQRDARPRRQLP
jgi:cytochrome c oxidase cbb3-type subunit III